MINSYDQFKEYLSADLSVRPGNGLLAILKDPISRFHCYLRSVEYLQGKRWVLPIYIVAKLIFLRSSKNLGFSIPENTLGKGVYLPHWGTIVVNSKARVGDYCILNVDVVIGRHPSSKQAVPTLGRGIYVAPGVKIFGKIDIGDNAILAANCVVNRDVSARPVVAGVPAKEVSQVNKELLNSYGVEFFTSN